MTGAKVIPLLHHLSDAPLLGGDGLGTRTEFRFELAQAADVGPVRLPDERRTMCHV
ncbi:hypothetical protein [Methylobacterium planeticum]|uniref:hypothetical protein n=1 Tax=Methylobacterium planeticum TaxID=2615211 RepID=UPI0017801C31|nr:hypothetical protein [Methylobacterium planeticum]